MKCRDARELINSYMDNGLNPEHDEHLMEHVKSCPKCGEELRFLIEYKSTLSGIKPVKAPERFMADLHRRLEAGTGYTLRRVLNDATTAWRRFSLPVEAAGVIAVATLIFFLYTPLFRGGKEMATYNERGISVERADEKKDSGHQTKLTPSEKIIHDNAVSVSSERKSPGIERENKRLELKEESAKSAIEKQDTEYGRTVSDKSRFDSAADVAAEKDFSAESLKKSDIQDETKTKGVLSRSKISREDALSPEKIITGSGGEILKKIPGEDGAAVYRVKVEESRLAALTKKLKENYTLSYRERGRSGKTLTVEFTVRKKSE